MIEYLYTEGRSVKVRLDGRIVGTIRPVTDGWQYFPKGQKTGGDIYPTLGECQCSLEPPPAFRDYNPRYRA